MSEEPMWTLQSALEFIAELSPLVREVGYELALAGSVLKSGGSNNDLDIIVFPTTTAHQHVEALELALRFFGLKKRFTREFVQGKWREGGSTDEKHVEIWYDSLDRRVDIFLLR